MLTHSLESVTHSGVFNFGLALKNDVMLDEWETAKVLAKCWNAIDELKNAAQITEMGTPIINTTVSDDGHKVCVGVMSQNAGKRAVMFSFIIDKDNVVTIEHEKAFQQMELL